jgi:hypothetical protein
MHALSNPLANSGITGNSAHSLGEVVAMKAYVYIACRGHSGSTLLEKLLATAPNAVALGEIAHFSHYFDHPEKPCGCGSSVRDCPFWNSVVRDLRLPPNTRVDEAMPTDGHRAGQFSENVPYYVALMSPKSMLSVLERKQGSIAWLNHRNVANHWRLVQAIDKIAGPTLFIDKSMSASRLLEIERQAPADYRVCAIHLVRDGRANAYSHHKLFGIPIERGARVWRQTNENIELALRRAVAVPRVVLRYEDLVTAPQQSLSKIASEFDLPDPFDVAQVAAPSHAIGGNHAKLTGYTNIAADERWRTGLSAADHACFDRHAGGLNRRYGYS